MTEAAKLTAEGVYADIPEDVYHADPVAGGSLSASGTKSILPALGGCPARFHYDQSHPKEPKNHFDFGHVAHALVLGRGKKFRVMDYKARSTNEYKEDAADARANNETPALIKDVVKAQEMLEALQNHPFAGQLFRDGVAEQVLIWKCPITGIMCRAMVDWLPNRPLIVPDYKTAASSHPDEWKRSFSNYSYFVQAAHVLEGVELLWRQEGGPPPKFCFVTQEKEPPYIVSVFEPDPIDVAWGKIVMLKARQLYQSCKAADHWPGYIEDVEIVSLPVYAHQNLERRHEAGDFELIDQYNKPLE